MLWQELPTVFVKKQLHISTYLYVFTYLYLYIYLYVMYISIYKYIMYVYMYIALTCFLTLSPCPKHNYAKVASPTWYIILC